MDQEIIDAINQKADEFKFDRNLIQAIVWQESSGNPKATRYEALYKWIYFPEKFAHDLGISVSAETMDQKTSFGLMQVMGAVARELDFKEELSKLCVPDIGLYYGCLKLRSLFQRTGYSESDAISSYNQGARRKTNGGMYMNQSYVDGVYEKYNTLMKLI